jgi:hypothetical protein
MQGVLVLSALTFAVKSAVTFVVALQNAQILVLRNLTTNTGQDNGSIKPDLVITDLENSNKLSSYRSVLKNAGFCKLAKPLRASILLRRVLQACKTQHY